MRIRGLLNLKDTLLCGQAFRWRKRDGAFYGVVEGNVIKIYETRRGNIYLESSGKFNYRHYFRLDDPLDRIYERINTDIYMEQVIRLYYGMRLLRQPPFETMISYIISIASNIPRISRTVEEIARNYGEEIEFEERTYYSFPTAGELAGVGENELRKMGLGFRAAYVVEAVKALTSGKLDLETLRYTSYPVAKKILMSIKGIGDKVADCILLFSLDKLSAYPVDRWVRRVTGELYFGGKNPTSLQIHRWAEDYFGEYAGYAQQYLFHYWRTGR